MIPKTTQSVTKLCSHTDDALLLEPPDPEAVDEEVDAGEATGVVGL